MTEIHIEEDFLIQDMLFFQGPPATRQDDRMTAPRFRALLLILLVFPLKVNSMWP